jgi:flagellar biosynthesis protein FliR
MEALANQLIATLAISLRIAPTFAFAPPFTLLRAPTVVRVLVGLALAWWIVLANPVQTYERSSTATTLLSIILSELALGMVFAIALQLAFAALLTIGRAVDIQVGFGLAQVADPSLRSQMPLIGTLFSYAAGAVFFATGGPADLIAIWSRSVTEIPLGAFAGLELEVLLQFISAAFVIAIGAASLVLLVLFLLDVAIAFMSRTLPQMNMLVLGFQIKTIALLTTLPFAIALSGSLLLRLMRLALDAMPRLT